jgi:hypothetical protein
MVTEVSAPRGMLNLVTARATSAVLVGRDTELAQLNDARKRAQAGEAAAVLVGGEAGVGKTRLIEEFTARAAADGGRVLIGRCLELGEEGLPFAPFAAALREVLRREGPGRRAMPSSPAGSSSTWSPASSSGWPPSARWCSSWKTCTGQTGPPATSWGSCCAPGAACAPC